MAVVQCGDGFMLLKSGGMGKVNTTLRNYFECVVVFLARTSAECSRSCPVRRLGVKALRAAHVGSVTIIS